MRQLRVLRDPPGSGAWNMAVDEALLHSAAEHKLPTLRFYTWQEPTLSLGYFQAAEDRRLHPASYECPLVRRSTGGGAILHDRELTYSLIMPHTIGTASAARLYEIVHQSLIQVLSKFGVWAAIYRDAQACDSAANVMTDPFLCFQRRSCFDVVAGPIKIAGSAQRRRGKGVLQHGSVLLAASEFAPELAGIRELTEIAISATELAGAWSECLARSLGATAREGSLSDSERSAAALFEGNKFAAADFTEKR